ncbi:MAG: Rieske 2Fe-2S domain-containing protein, partial [Thermaceae bacterium]|nr:Rieske 2Fe-2S domain-containing protein [Thermaceae bacterium]
ATPPAPTTNLQLTAPAKVADLTKLSADGQFMVATVATNQGANYPVVVVAASSASALSGAILHPSVAGLYLLAFSRVCTHQGTTIDNPAGGLMHCSNHGQDYDLKTGNPTGSANKTTVPLAQFSLEVRNTSELWVTTVLRDGGSGGGTTPPAPTTALTLNAPTKIATLAQVAGNGQFLVSTLATNLNASYPVVVLAASSTTALSGGLPHPTVPNLYILAFSRVCTHQGTTIDPPTGGKMHCSNHGQDYTLTTGSPTGNANQTTVPLAQFGLEVRNATEVWAISVVRDGGSGGGGGDD